MIIGHIGARMDSKGVPGKNFRQICGKPLIDWSLDQLFAHARVDAVIVSSDDPEIYAHGVARGALPMGLRPAHLATDGAGKMGRVAACPAGSRGAGGWPCDGLS